MEKIQIVKNKPWGAIPEALITDPRLGHAAVRLGVWLAIRPDGWRVWKEHSKRECRLGEDSWDRACRELKNAGYLMVKTSRSGGRFGGLQLEFNPQPELSTNTATVDGFTVHGSTGDGKPAQLTRTHEQKPPPPEHTCVSQVVVNEGRDSEPRRPVDQKDPGLHWPPGLSQSQEKAMGAALGGVDTGRRQELLDEVAGRMVSPTPVGNPPGLLRMLVNLAQAGTLTCELADGVRAVREARQAHQMRSDRLSAAGGGSGCQGGKLALKAATAPSAAALAERAALRAARQPGGRWAS